jgi:hypothetical protein
MADWRKHGFACALLALSLVGTGAASAARPAWVGNFDGGALGQWTTRQAVPGGVELVKKPRRDGRYAARFEVRPGDDPIDANGERAELATGVSEIGGTEGTTTWYGWSTYFPRSLHPTLGERTTNIFTQWHQTKLERPTCAPPVTFHLGTESRTPTLRLRLRGGRELSTCVYESMGNWDFGKVEYNRWYDFVVHVRWSSDPDDGFIEVWLNGENVVPRMTAATLIPGAGVYLKQGYYRTESRKKSVIFHDAMRRGSSRAAVDPAA